jgi:hypothetical protein
MLAPIAVHFIYRIGYADLDRSVGLWRPVTGIKCHFSAQNSQGRLCELFIKSESRQLWKEFSLSESA